MCVIPNTKIHLGAKEFNGSYGYGVHEYVALLVTLFGLSVIAVEVNSIGKS